MNMNHQAEISFLLLSRTARGALRVPSSHACREHEACRASDGQGNLDERPRFQAEAAGIPWDRRREQDAYDADARD
jgi:hypothetical protein